MSSLSTGDSGQHNVVRETVFYRLDKLVWEMRQAKSGLEMKLQKTFFSSTPSACTGKELVNWLRVKLLTPSETEALHLANALCRLGFIVPVNERQHTVKLDSSCYRIQRPALWPSRKWDSTSQEYAVYLLKKLEKGRSLEHYEQAALTKLEQVHTSVWANLKVAAKESLSKYSRGCKVDRDIEDSQDRCFWKVQRPPPSHKPHPRNDIFSRNSVCMEVINLSRKREIIEKKIKFLNVYLDKAKSHSEFAGEKAITILMNHCVNYAQHDPIITKQEMTNPWIAIDEYFYEDLIDLEDKGHTKLELESWRLGFRELLSDPYGKQLFATFLNQEYSLENLHFWDACDDLKRSPQSKIQDKIEKIKRDHLQSSSKYEVNLDRLVLQQTLEEMKTPSRYCMDKAQQHIYTLMKTDCYPRFLKSDLYKSLLAEFIDKRRKKKLTAIMSVKAGVLDDEVDKVSDDSGTYSGIYSSATYSPKSKLSTKKMSIKKKQSFHR